jgi:hypothetical protein
MRKIFLFACAATLAGAGAGAPAAAKDSWARPYVGFEEYRRDADQCSNAAFQARLWFGPIVHLAQATHAMATDPWSYARARQIFVHGVTRTVAEQLQDAVDRCLFDRGYRRFRLSEEQNRRLGRLHRGTVERARFLHSLAADPAVLGTQALPTVRPPDEPAQEDPPARREPLDILDFGPPRPA